MKQLLLLAALPLLGACDGDHEDVAAEVFYEGPAPAADLLVEARNQDPFDYDLWLDWQDETGAWNSTYLFSVYGDSHDGPTREFAIVTVCPDCPYTVVLTDFDGTVWDSYVVWASADCMTEVRFDVIDGWLIRTS